MAGPLQKAKRGDPLVIPAGTFNTFIDAAREFQQRQQDRARTAQPERADAGMVLVRNESGSARNRFDVLGISGPLVKPDDNEDAFKQRVALRGVTPGAAHLDRFVVLLEPASPNALVRACIDGVCQARVRMHTEEDGYAHAKIGLTSRLESGSTGSARLLWVEPIGERDNPEIAWAIVRLGVETASVWCAAVDSIPIGAKWLICRDLDDDGNPVGDTYPVDVLTAPTLGVSVGICFPRLSAGSRVLVCRTRGPRQSGGTPAFGDGVFLTTILTESCA